jgi:hypothetical protein
MVTQVCEAHDPPAPHTWICAICGLEYLPGDHDFRLCAWRQEQRRIYEQTGREEDR